MPVDTDKIIVGMTGPFGSGCTYIASNILAKLGYEYISLSDILREEIGDTSLPRTNMQDKGNEIRKNNGANFLAKKAIEKIKKSKKKKFVVDSIRNTHEIDLLKQTFTKFFLFAIWADKNTRWERIKDKYGNNNELFETDDRRDKDEKDESGQQITLCYQMADIIVLNKKIIHAENSDDFRGLQKIIERYIDIIEKKIKYIPSEMETLMSMAYANSMRSSCSQRKVGAIIIDNYGNVFSSGYNEVPQSELPCQNIYGECYRKHLRSELNDKIYELVKNEEVAKGISDIVNKNSKMLDYCRALHAEENAIVNMARLSVSVDLSESTLYTTTYPCNLCANKIAQVGIKKIVYYEPYPQEEAKNTLNKHNVIQKPFEGVTFNAYFKFMEVLR